MQILTITINNFVQSAGGYTPEQLKEIQSLLYECEDIDNETLLHNLVHHIDELETIIEERDTQIASLTQRKGK